MEDYRVLPDEEFKNELAKLPGWAVDSGKLAKKFHFSGFTTAASFIHNHISRVANELYHHPDVHLTSYRVLKVETITHDVGSKFTQYDIWLAKGIQEAYDKLPESDKKFDPKA